MVVSVALAPSVCAQSSGPAVTMSQEGLEPLAIVTSSGRHAFRVEFARSGPQLERGLMYRRDLPQDRGMLFDFQTSQPIMMWMKNTYVPLDMIFIAQNGKVTHITKNAEPLSEAIIPSDGPAYAVLEVNAGVADRIGLKPGDRVEHALFKP